MAALSVTLDRLRSQAIRRSLAVLTTVDPAAIWVTWPAAGAALTEVVAETQNSAVDAVTRHLEQQVATAVGAEMGWDLTGLVTETVSIPRLAARMAATPQLVTARIAAGATPVESFARTVTWATQIAGSVAHETARQGTAAATAALPAFSGWRWDPEAGACPWCRMQATRGAVFKADTVLHSHAHCRCDAVEVTDRAEAGRIARDGRAEWARIQRTGDVPGAQRRTGGGLPRPGADPARVQPGAQTPERLASVRAQIASYERNPATGDKAGAWQQQRLADLRAEEALLAA